MPRKAALNSEDNPNDMISSQLVTEIDINTQEVENLSRMLAAVLDYLSDDEVEEIDIESLLTNTEGLREWWDDYRENNRKEIEEEIKKSLSDLPLKELEQLWGQIKELNL